MADVQIRSVVKSYGESQILKGIDLDIQDGEFVVFVGPSGCGKSTLLRSIAGLEEVNGGELRIGGRVVNDVPPAERGIAMVFQSYALYPHMNLFDNMAFGLKLAKVPKAEIEAAVMHAARILHIDHLLERKPKELSGGQRQRVAIGRAIVRQPQVFLFDEPLSNLDAALRHETRLELARLHEELGTTIVYVTHDQVEAMTLGDRIAVFNEGRIEQVGTPLQVYERPHNRFVAGFLGAPRINFLPVQALPGLPLPTRTESIGLRPEHMRLQDPAGSRLAGEITLIEYLGDACIAHVRVEGLPQPLAVKLGAGVSWQRHQRVGLDWADERLLAFDAQGLRL